MEVVLGIWPKGKIPPILVTASSMLLPFVIFPVAE